jgi:hypothetical protein
MARANPRNAGLIAYSINTEVPPHDFHAGPVPACLVKHVDLQLRHQSEQHDLNADNDQQYRK